jgi:putative transposase
MNELTDFGLENPHTLPLEELLRLGAQMMLHTAVEAELAAFLQAHAHLKTEDGRAALVRNGHHDTRTITVRSGQVEVTVPRTRNRANGPENFISTLIAPYKRRSMTIDEAIPTLYLLGISTGQMLPALESLLGSNLHGISATNVTRLKRCWEEEHAAWSQRSLAEADYCYVWVDGVYFSLRGNEDRICLFVVIGARTDGRKELISVATGYRESTESWARVLRDLRDRGMNAPKLMIGDGALGIWAAARAVFPTAVHQRCWNHKALNILDTMPKRVQGRARGMLREIWSSETRQDALRAIDAFATAFEPKYPKAVACLVKDKEALLAFYDFPAEHWRHLRTSNIIESTFASVRLRTEKTRGHGTESSTLTMVYKLLELASKRWRKLNGCLIIPLVMQGVVYQDGIMKKAA